MGDPDLDVAGVGRLVEVAQLERRRRRPGGVVLVGDRRPEDAVEVGALVAERQLEDVAAVAGHDRLGPPDERVELVDRVGVVVVVDPAEAQEHRVGRPQLGEQLAPRRAHPLVDLGQDPRRHQRLVERRRLLDVVRRDLDVQCLDDAERPLPLLVVAQRADRDAALERRQRRGLEHDLALVGVVLGLGEVVDHRPGEDVDQLDLGVADDEPPRPTDRDRDLERELDLRPGRRPDPPDPGHRLLHREPGRGRPGAVVAVEPAGDRVAREVDDVAAPPVELVDHGVEDAAEVRGQLLRAALRAQLVRERLGEGREARDIGEERRALDAVGHVEVARERPAPVPGDVRLGIVAGQVDGALDGGGHRTAQHCAGRCRWARRCARTLGP